MTRALPVVLLIVAASCNTLTSPSDDRLHGNWRGPTASVAADASFLYIYLDSSAAQTDRAISLGTAGVFQARGFWAPHATPERPDRTAEFRRIRVSGSLHSTRGPLRLMVTDSASGHRYVDETLQWFLPPPPPPPNP